jgi:ferredoxin-NADP reductase
MLATNFINTVTDEKTDKYDNSLINKDYLQKKIKDFSKYFYVCGPLPMIDSVCKGLGELGADNDKIVIDQF